jgi:hypothetical protein
MILLISDYGFEKPRGFSSKKKAFEVYQKTSAETKPYSYSRFCELLNEGKKFNYDRKGYSFNFNASFQEVGIE